MPLGVLVLGKCDMVVGKSLCVSMHTIVCTCTFMFNQPVCTSCMPYVCVSCDNGVVVFGMSL